MARELTARCFISINDAPPVPFESLSEETLEQAKRAMSARLERNMSAYFSQHPEEYARIR